MNLTTNQLIVLGGVARWNDEHEGGNYMTGDGNQERTLRSLERKGLVTRKNTGGCWWITDKGRTVLDARH